MIHHLRSGGVSLVLSVTDDRLPVVLHWGADLGDVSEEVLAELAAAVAPQPFGYPVDGSMPVSVLPEASTGWPGVRGVTGHRAGAAPSTLFRVTSVDAAPREAPWSAGVVVDATDEAAGLGLRLEIEQALTGLLRLRASITSLADGSAGAWDLAGVLPVLPVPARATELLDLTGHHLRERSPQRLPFAHGTHERATHRGRPGFDTGYLLCAGEAGFGDRSGEVWGVHLGWSGNQRMLAERSYHGVRLLGAGELLEPGEVRLAPGETYTAPWTYATYGDGLDDASARVHEWMRARPHHPRTPRPVIANTWEAVVFDHDHDRLVALADAAAEVGAERFVLDDGWFGSRRSDASGLGDWVVSADVHPDGLGPLIDHVRSLGMEFGLWVEPEMVNPDSDVARAHPEWVMSAAGGRWPTSERNQQVLNLADPGAYAHVLGQLDALLTEYPIAYLKWDQNREINDAGLPPSGRGAVRAQVTATYAMMDELKRRHPGLEIESCSSGGARVDLGVLEHTERVWASDSTDAHERLGIQRWTNLLIPYEFIGSHVSSPVAPTSGRSLPLDFRCAVALFGHFGIEWDVSEATPDERERLAAWVAYYKERRGLLHSGRAVHADVPDPSHDLHGVVAPDGGEALFAWVCSATSDTWPPPAVRLPGLDPERTYRVSQDGPAGTIDSLASLWGMHLPWTRTGSVTLPGRVLAEVGLAMPVLHPDRAMLLRVEAVG